ncbi:interferon alpha-inducible protein 27-like protein 2A isoform X2 [Lathamus discolor]|uniref:interferon alpha-inducible protein 27-like protein 2A isoform X2 n=1 Tax=Lathamus discolor TaxID=678569 RepID=UPI0032B7AE0D
MGGTGREGSSPSPGLGPILRPAGRGPAPRAAMVSKLMGAAIGATVGAGAVLIGIPVAVGALGFTSTGIAAGSVAAKMMSAAAIANGGGVAAGSTVAVLQSIGAAIGAKLSKGKEKPPGDEDEESQNSDED